MHIQDFSFDSFAYYRHEKETALHRFLSDKGPRLAVISQPDSYHWTSVCKYHESSLESQLDYLTACMKTNSDLSFTYLEPWYGVGVYAAAYGCKYEFSANEPPQTRPLYDDATQVEHLPMPSIRDCEVMQVILERIRYFKEHVSDYIDISITDTQSPNDTASLILDPCEFFVSALSDPEQLEGFLKNITQLTIHFTEMQFEAAGNNLSRPGHIMLCDKSLGGLAISDDNMAFLSPQVYNTSAYPYNEMLSRHFGGISIHTCGNASANLARLAQTPGLFMVDLALGTAVDPTPNPADAVLDAFRNTNTIVKVKVGDEELDKIRPLVQSDLKLIVELRMNCHSIEERNRRYHTAKETLLSF